MLLDGVAALASILRQAGYQSVAAAVAEHTVFLDPRTVVQSAGSPIFPVIRGMPARGTFTTLTDGRTVMLDDNTTPTWAFLSAAGRGNGRDVQYNHVWSDAKNPDLYTALWNLCVSPAFLAKTTDGQNHPEVRAMLRYRAFQLYGYLPTGESPPDIPDGFHELKWAPMPDPVPDLEAAYRHRLATAPKSRPALAARTLGWLFSEGKPDGTVGFDRALPGGST